MYRITNSHRIISVFLITLFFNLVIGSTFASAQQKNTQALLNNSTANNMSTIQIPDSTKIHFFQDQQKAKIIFNEEYFEKKIELKLISSSKFEVEGETKLVGQKGINLKAAMGENTNAIALVDDAYRVRESGMLLMGLGVAAALVTFLVAPAVEIGETESGYYTTTYYWLPFVTVGCVLGGLGLAKYNSLERRLSVAVLTYNDDLNRPKDDTIK